MEDGKDGEQGSTFKAYDSPGEERLRTSNSPAAPIPSKTSDERAQAPDPYLSSLGGATPGSDNPALDHTRNHALGQVSTADLLRAREFAEEEYLRRGGSEGAVPGTTVTPEQLQTLRPAEVQDTDAGQHPWFDDLQQPTRAYLDSNAAPHPVGHNIEEDTVEHIEFEELTPVSETEVLMPKMKNISSEGEENG